MRTNVRQRILFIGIPLILVILVAGVVVSRGHIQRPDKIVVAKAKPPAKGSSGIWGDMDSDIREVGQEAVTIQEAESRVSRKAKLPDEKLTGGKPMIRTEAETLILIYPNDLVITALPFMWPGKDVRQHYVEVVKGNNNLIADSGNVENRPADLNNRYKLVDVAGNPGYELEKGDALYSGKRYPKPAFMCWTQDGVEYRASGTLDMPLKELIPIAESVANGGKTVSGDTVFESTDTISSDDATISIDTSSN